MPFHPDYGWYDDGTDTNPNTPYDMNVVARGGDPNAWWNIAAGNGATYSAPTSAMLVGDMDAIEKIKQAGLKSGYFYEGEDDAGFGSVLKLALLAAGVAGGLGFLGGETALGEGLGALNSFDTGAMASALNGGTAAAGGLTASGVADGLEALNSFDTGAMANALNGGTATTVAEGVGIAEGLGYGPNGDLTLEQFLTSPDNVTGLEGFGGSQGFPAMDTLGSTSWLESAVNSLKHGDTSWLTSSVSPTQIKSVLSKVLGGESTPAKTGAAKTAAGAGAAGGINIFNTGGDDSGLADAMKIFSGGRSGMDSVVQAMSQSGKGN